MIEKEKIELLSFSHGTFNNGVSQFVWVILGVLLIGITTLNIISSGSINTISVFLILNAVLSILYGTFLVNKRSKYSLKIVVNDHQLSINNSLFRPPYSFSWSNIDYLTLGSYQITVHTATKSHIFHYKSSQQASKRIKDMVLTQAKKVNVSVFEA